MNMGTTIKVSNREIAIRAFEHLRQERKTDSALRLAHHLLHYLSLIHISEPTRP